MSGALLIPFLALTQYPGSQTIRQLPPSLQGPPAFFRTHPQDGFQQPTAYSGMPFTQARDRPRAKAPLTFTPPKDDMRCWIMEMEDYMIAENITDPAFQALTARDYLA